ncbi:MAG: hypothetical protein HYR55_13195 [Acidobacteria bacterium]|nr:hypothetical protein [Acidobacteriota bacterium]
MLLLTTIIGVLILTKVFGLGERLVALRGWIQTLGIWGRWFSCSCTP